MAKRYYCVKTCLGKYSAWFRTLYGPKRFRDEISTVEKFLYSYPNKKYIRLFTEEEVDDWAIERNKTVSAGRVSIELGRIRRFWKWVSEHMGYELPHPVLRTRRRIDKKIPVRNKKTLSLPELRVVCSEISDVSLQRMILAKLLGGVFIPNRPTSGIYNIFRRAVRRVGMEYTWIDFLRSVPRLRLSILQDLRYQLCDSLPFKAQGRSAALRYIQIPEIEAMLLNKRPPVSNRNEEDPCVLRVDESQPASERQVSVSDSECHRIEPMTVSGELPHL